MRVYWMKRRRGQRLVLAADDGSEVEVGAVRQTPRGFDALANTNTYDPGRAQRDFATVEEAKDFVESFRPWEIFGGDWDLEVEPEVQPGEGSVSTSEELGGDEGSGQADKPAEPTPAPEPAAESAPEPAAERTPAASRRAHPGADRRVRAGAGRRAHPGASRRAHPGAGR